MIDENEAAQAEGEALPGSGPQPPYVPSIPFELEHLPGRVIAAVEAWYAEHFHRAVVAGAAPISSEDKAALIQHVTDAVSPTAAAGE